MFQLTEWIRTHLNEFFAIVLGLGILTFALLNPGWWGERAFGVLIGVAILAIILPISIVILEKTLFDEDKILPWILVIVPTATALILRRISGYNLVWPIQFKTPGVPSPQSLFLILIAFLVLMLVIIFVRALNRGEGVTIESNWGGLGGGIGGFQLSAPLIYLLGIVFLLAVASALAWRIFPPPATEQTESTEPQQSATNTKPRGTASPSAASPAATASVTPSPAISSSPGP